MDPGVKKCPRSSNLRTRKIPGEIFLGEFLTIVGDLLGLLTNPFSQEKNTIETLMMECSGSIEGWGVDWGF